MTLMSAPAAKIRSPPQTTTARIAASDATTAAATDSSSDTGRASAFAGGRSMRIVATAPSDSTRTNSAMAPILADRAALAFAAVGPTPQEAANVRRALKRLRAEPVAFGAVTTGGD